MSETFSREELEDVVNCIYCGVNPNMDENSEIMKIARVIVKSYLISHIPLNISTEYYFKYKKTEKEN